MAESSSLGEERTSWATEPKSTAQSTLVLDGVELKDVPEVEVKNRVSSDTPVHATSVGGEIAYCQLNPEQQKDFEERIKREQAKKYFSLREGAFEKAVEECKKTTINLASDGSLLSSWLLTEIDHWDLEKERIVLVTEKQLIIVKYNFIGLRVDDCRKIPLLKCDKVQIGRFIYPKSTMMIPRHFQNGIRINCGKNNVVTYSQSWNPWSKEIPFVTFRDHRGCEFLSEVPTYLKVNLFAEEVVSVIRSAHAKCDVGDESLEISKEPIPMKIYIGISTLTHNWAILGFNRDRGKYGY